MTLGMISIVLGTIGLLLFFLPILGLPLGAAGLLLGLVGVVAACLGSRSEMRWPLVGIVVCSAAISIALAIAFAPLGYEPSRAVPRLWQTPPDSPYVPPPMRPNGNLNSR
jgi:hypothetical protein